MYAVLCKNNSHEAEKAKVRSDAVKLFIEQSEWEQEPEIHIKCKTIDEKLQRIIDQLQLMTLTVTGKNGGAIHKLSFEDIYYFESVDDKVFACCEVEVYETTHKLYEIEKMMAENSFARISKSVILNINKIQSIRPQFNGRFEAMLLNGERQIVNRHYVSGLRDKFMGGVK